MAVTVRTNRATNPSAASTTGYAANGGSGTAALTNVTTHPLYGPSNNKVTWSVATTTVSGGVEYTQSTGLAAATQYTVQMWVYSSIVQRMQPSVVFTDAGASWVNTVYGSVVVLNAGEWTQLTVTATSGAAVTGCIARAYAIAGTGGANWGVGASLEIDAVQIETGPTATVYFDGSYSDGLGTMYAWTGTANASTSTATLYTPALSLVAKYDAPCDRVEITVSDLPPVTNNVTLWRTADGKRRPVRGFRRYPVIDSDFVADYEAPLSRIITYELEITDGIGVDGPTDQDTITLTPAGPSYGWIQDPLDPSTAIKLYGDVGPAGEPALSHESVRNLEYAADTTLIPIMGSEEPVALLSQRMIAGKVPFKMLTDAAQMSTDLRNLLMQAPLILIRPLPEWGNALPGLCYMAPPVPVEDPINVAWGGTLTEWKFETGLVAPSTMNVVIPVWTYGDVQDLWGTYQDAQTALSGKTYLQVRISPPNGV